MSENETNTEEGTDGQDILIVASKLKKYIRESAGMNTSANVLSKLSSEIRKLCDTAIENAKTDGRKTVMDRDFSLLKSKVCNRIGRLRRSSQFAKEKGGWKHCPFLLCSSLRITRVS